MRSLPEGDSIPVLVLCAAGDAGSIDLAFQAGATDLATKPISSVTLKHRIRYLLRMQRVVEDLRRSEASLEMAQRIAAIGSWTWDVATGSTTCSAETRRLLCLDPSTDAVGLDDLLGRLDRSDATAFQEALRSALDEDRPFGLDCRIEAAEGVVRYAHVQAEVVRGPTGQPASVSGTIQDVTERKQAEDKIRLLAFYDGLTGLPNRVSFHDRLRRTLATAKKRKHLVAVMFLDMDDFKRINDSAGHGAGDQLLREVADRLSTSIRYSDTLARDDPGGAAKGLLARLGGDEFTILLPGLGKAEDTAKVAQRILESLRTSFVIGGNEVFISASLGISVFPQDGKTPEELLRNADTALYHAKDQGRNNFQFYDASLNERAVQRLELESALRLAIERNEFLVYFQSQLDAHRGELIGIEALIRWRHPERGLVLPDVFVPLAEETGLIKAIDEWVLGEACRRAFGWRRAGLPRVPVAVNLSGHQFRRDDLVERLNQTVRETGLFPHDVELEITETVLMEDVTHAIMVLNDLKALGFRIAVDDFGIGYSSLNYLRRLPLDVLKIDKSFLQEVPRNKENAKIVAAIVSLAHSLNIETIAEGVETPEQRDFLLEQGCHSMQGFLFGGPMTAEETEGLLRTPPFREAKVL